MIPAKLADEIGSCMFIDCYPCQRNLALLIVLPHSLRAPLQVRLYNLVVPIISHEF
jgi:hypothetical protein